MALIINHNLPAMTAARHLGSIYSSLGKSIERLSSGLRINKAADDAAGLAVREMMRADIATTLQGIRNAADAVSMIQTADGALGVIDAKLIRMKELAEQAATGTYTTAQRELINSEFQAMATEIDRIAHATNFNGIRLLDGTTLNQNGGQGIRIHFGVNNNDGEDYYYVYTGDVRASSPTGLNVGGDSTNDIWSTGGVPGSNLKNCCGGTFQSMGATVMTGNTSGLILGYNWDLYAPAINDDGASLTTPAALGRHIMGKYESATALAQTTTLEELITEINKGSQSRVQIDISTELLEATPAASVICLGNGEAYYVGNANSALTLAGAGTAMTVLAAGTAVGLATAVNNNVNSKFWAVADGTTAWVFYKEGGDNNTETAGFKTNGTTDANKVGFTNMATGAKSSALIEFSLGGEDWITARADGNDTDGYNLILEGRNAGDGSDIKIVKTGDALLTLIPGTPALVAPSFASSLLQVQDANDGQGTLRTQEAAQRALETVTAAIMRKDNVRANLGAMQNRLEATIENLTIQAENLQASESRISDVDVATEMTEYTKNNILAQAAASMLAQANSLSSLALVLLNG
jgi:flagellin